jgi:hypothetical protein
MASTNSIARKHFASIGKLEIVQANLDDAKYLQDNLRPQDVRECMIHGVTPNRALHMPLADDNCITYTALVDDIPICMFGTMQNYENKKLGSVWLLGTKGIEKNYFSFLKASIELVELLQQNFEVLENVVPIDHSKTILWLKWLGFIFHKDPVIVNSFACLRFVRCQDDVEVQILNS